MMYGQSILRKNEHVCTYTTLSVNKSFKTIEDSIFSIIPRKKEFEKYVKSKQYYISISISHSNSNDSIVNISVDLDDYCPCINDYGKSDHYYCKLRGYNTIWWTDKPISNWFTIGSKESKLKFVEYTYYNLVSGLENIETGEPWYFIYLEYNTFTNKVRIKQKDIPSFNK